MAERHSSGGDAQRAATVARIDRQIGLSRLAIALERGARAFWPVWSLVFATLAAWMLGLGPGSGWGLEPRGQLIFAVAALVALAALIWRGMRRFRWPGREEAAARLDAGLAERPIAALADSQAIGSNDPASQAVWARHIERMTARAANARATPPDLALARSDPWALRLMALIALGVAALFAGRAAPPDFAAGLPGAGAVEIATGPSFEAWANPPVYTGKPTIYFSSDTPAALDLPQGTEITIRVYGAEEGFAVEETVSGAPSPLAEIAPGIRAATFPVTRSGAVTLRRAEDALDSRQITMTADLPPEIAFDGEVERAVSGAMKLPFRATDDYAVETARAEITLDLASVDRRHGLGIDPEPREPIVLDLPMSLAGKAHEVEETLTEDLIEHAWVGLPVTISLIAEDALGQEGTAAQGDIVLPGRRFFDPLARAIIEQRRDLLWSAENHGRVDQMLRTLTHAPEDVFTNRTAYLMTRMAIRRMGYAQADGFSAEERDDIAALLWQTALLIEDGSLSDARERLRRAQDRLSDALQNGATDEEIAELMDQLREAMQDYMEQLAQEALRNQDQQQAQRDENRMQLSQNQLQDLLDRIEELANSGQQEQAEALLEQLRQMLENLQMQAQQGEGQGQEGQQMLQELQDTLRQQQDLADDSFQELQRQFNQGRQQQGQQGQEGQQQGGQPGQQQGQQGTDGQQQFGQGQQPGGSPDGRQMGQGLSPGELARRQEALRQMLDDLRGRLPGPSTDEGTAARESLGEAEDQMGAARDNLDEGDLDGALDRQADAMDALREGIRNLGEELQQQAQENQGDSPGQFGEGNTRDNRDPLGRPSGQRGNIRSDEHLLPGEEALRRAQELFDEIRRRSGDQRRPAEELEYLKRLLDRF